jgi:hypothetical protein
LSLEREKTPIAQIWVWIIGTIILTVGVGLADTGHAVGDPIAGVGSVICGPPSS